MTYFHKLNLISILSLVEATEVTLSRLDQIKLVKEINVVVEVHNMRYRVLLLYKKSLSDKQRLRKLAIAIKGKMEFMQVSPLFANSRPLPNKDSTKAPFFYIAGVIIAHYLRQNNGSSFCCLCPLHCPLYFYIVRKWEDVAINFSQDDIPLTAVAHA